MSKRKQRHPDLAEFLASPATKVGIKCATCRRSEIAVDLAEFLVALEEGGTRKTLHAFYHEYVRARYDDPPCFNSLRHHAHRCLGRDTETGRRIR